MIRKVSEFVKYLFPFTTKLETSLPNKYKIGMVILVHERPEYLEACLESLFNTNLYEYDITFLIQDDGSKDPKVKEIVNRPRPSKYKIIRKFTEKKGSSWGYAFNKGIKNLIYLGEFDIIGSCDSDTIFHPEWLDKTLKIAIWAKKYHRSHTLGPFSSFNSSDFKTHKILGKYKSPFGEYVVQKQMGAVNYFYFMADFKRLGFFEENSSDEINMTKRFDKYKIRNFCTSISYVEHIGINSILGLKRHKFVRSPYGRNMPKVGWPQSISRFETLGYYKYLKSPKTYNHDKLFSNLELDLVITASKKDHSFLTYMIKLFRKNLKHPIKTISIISDDDKKIQNLCKEFKYDYLNVRDLINSDIYDFKLKHSDDAYLDPILGKLLKFSIDSIFNSERLLIIEPKVLFTSPQIFCHKGKSLLLHSDQFNYSNFIFLEKLLDIEPLVQLSFLSNHILFNTKRLQELKIEIETKHHMSWFEALKKLLMINESLSFSEYETYGHWMLHRYPDEIYREYWYNRTYELSEIPQIDKLIKMSKNTYRSINFS